MFGLIGKLAGGVVGGLLDKIGLGKIAPFVKMGLNALTGNWLGVAQDVFGLVSKFKGNPLDKAANRPPLGNFDQQTQPTNAFQQDGNTNTNSLNNNRISDLLRSLSELFKSFSGQNTADNNNNAGGGFEKIINALRTLSEAFGNNQLYNNRVSVSQFTHIQA